jgi:hypothetical protein
MRWDMNPSRKNASKKAGRVDWSAAAAPCPCIEWANANGCDGSDTEELAAASGDGIVIARDGADCVWRCCGAIGVGSRMGRSVLLFPLIVAMEGGIQGGALSSMRPPPSGMV